MTLKPTSSAGGGGGGSVPFPTQSGDGSPIDNAVTPTAIGSLYVDTTNGGLYLGIGATDADWVSVAGDTDPGSDAAVGVNSGLGDVALLAGAGTAYLTDNAGFEGTGNTLKWVGAGGDGSQSLHVITGSNGQYHGILQDSSGAMSMPGSVTAIDLIASPGDITADGTVRGATVSGTTVSATGAVLAYDQNDPGSQQTVTGALSSVVDPNAQAVLTSILAALVAYGFVLDDTT